jgi:hypothetical protein
MLRSKRMRLGEGLLAEVTFTILATLHQDYGGGENFLHEIQGKIVIRNADDETEEPAGEVRAWLVQFNEAQAHGISARILGDGYSQEISIYWQELFDGDDFTVEIQNGWQTEGIDLLIVGSVDIHPKFERSGVGLAALGRTIDLFSRSCDLVACVPEEMRNYSNPQPDSSPREAQTMEADEEEAIACLRSYCLKSGFRPLGQTGIFLLNPTHERPDRLLE